jgi:hypothetical protein
MTAPQPDSEMDMTEVLANVVISYTRFREYQDRRRAIAVAPAPSDQPLTLAAYIVHIEAATAALRPLNGTPC